MPLLLALALLALLMATPTAHASSAGDAKQVIAVLYFDNNTGEPSLDVLQKGFADMMVTDLSSLEQLQVVERDKLQKLLDELKLQRAAYFDPKTAQRLGRGVGAQYAVAGSFQAVDPELRIDIRLVEIATARIVLADKVTGKKARLFDLQQQLVNRFAAGLELKLGQPPRLRSRAPDVATLLSYSQGLHLADQGKLKEASQQLAQVVSKAPTFLLARERHEQLLARLEASEQRRADTLAEAAETLGRKAEELLQSQDFSTLEQPQSAAFLGWRLIRMQYLSRLLRQHLTPKGSPHVVLPGHERQALELMQLIREQGLAYVRESSAHFHRFAQVYNGESYLSDTDLELPPEDMELVKQVHYGPLRFDDEAALGVAKFLLLGKLEEGSESANRLQFGPTLSDLDPAAEADGLRLLEQATEAADKQPARRRELAFRRAVELHGEALLSKGRVEEAVAKWQQFLDRYPASNAFQSFSDKIKTALGVGPNQHANLAALYPQALETCDESILHRGYSQELDRRMLRRGHQAPSELFNELYERCGHEKKLRIPLRSLLTTAALAAANAGDCDSFHEFMRRYVEMGGGASDVKGYLKNYVPHCQRAGEEQPAAQP